MDSLEGSSFDETEELKTTIADQLAEVRSDFKNTVSPLRLILLL